MDIRRANALQHGDRVKVVEPFQSDSTHGRYLFEGLQGTVKIIDTDGDASILFDFPKERGLVIFRKSGRQWVCQNNFRKLTILFSTARRPQLGHTVRLKARGVVGTIVEDNKALAQFKIDTGNGVALWFKETGVEAMPLPAHAWHSKRRAALLQHPGVKSFIKECSRTAQADLFIDVAIAAGVVCLHVCAAVMLQQFGSRMGVMSLAIAVLVTSACLGAQCAFLMQGLNHELAHRCEKLQKLTFSRPSTQGALHAGSLGVSVIGAALCHMPWAAYYWGDGHQRHHRYAGSQQDVDGDAIFWVWQPPVQWGTVARFCWVSFAVMLLPSILVYSVVRATVHYGWRENRTEWLMLGIDFVATGCAHVLVGPVGAVYLFLSSCFSMGFFCHPLMAFWILQHLCVHEKQQPTVSYYGSYLWNVLCLNELLHVEHHDFRTIRWWYMPKLKNLAPEFYKSLHVERSIFSLIRDWLRADIKHIAYDFACRARNGFEMFDSSPGWGPYDKD